MEQDKYKDVPDEQLIVCLRNGQTAVMDYLMEKYKNLVRKRANALYLIGGETEDLIQEGMIGLFKAVQDFRTDKDVSFYHFAELCINRQMYTAVEAAQRKAYAAEYVCPSGSAGGRRRRDLSGNRESPTDFGSGNAVYQPGDGTAGAQAGK